MPDLAENSFKGTRKPYIGMAIMAAISGCIGYYSDWMLVHIVTGIMGSLAVYGSLVDRVSIVSAMGEGIQIMRGDLKISREMPLAQIKSLTLSKDRDKSNAAQSLLEMNLDEVKNWDDCKYLVIQMADGKRDFSIYQNDFDQEEFVRMVKGVKEHYLEVQATPAQKAKRVLQQTLRYISEDKHLRNELKATLIEVYTTIYKPQETLLSKQVMQEMDKDPDVLFHAVKQGNVLLYFSKDKPRHDIPPANVPIAHQLIEAGMENLEIVEKRLASHEQVKARLEHMILKLDQQQSLDNMASKINQLQQRNLQKAVFDKDVSFETEVVAQLQQLSEDIHSADTLESVYALTEYMKMFKA